MNTKEKYWYFQVIVFALYSVVLIINTFIKFLELFIDKTIDLGAPLAIYWAIWFIWVNTTYIDIYDND